MFEIFEKELGIVLNPRDFEIIKDLTETYKIEQIKEALKIAKQNNARSVKYVVRILNSIDNDPVPSWFNKEYVKEPLTDKDKLNIEEAINCLREWHPNNFEKWAQSQRVRNGI